MDLRRVAAAGALLAAMLAVALLGSGGSGGGGDPTAYTVTALMDERPLDSRVVVTANVSRVRPDYEADSGNVYQQFDVSDGNSRVLVFCSTRAGRVNVSRGDTVRVDGTFQEFYGTDEIYTSCRSIRHVR